MELLNVKGSNDYLPKKQILRNKIINILTKYFEAYGYLPVETTTLCYYDLLASKYAGGAEILKEVYKLKDQGNRELGLRYDLTVPFSKIISMNLNKEIELPFRRYEIGKVYRDGPVKLGRDREFYQCDVDVCGISSVLAEAELLQMSSICYKELGININILWNNRKFLSGLIIESGINDDITNKVILSVDKLAKIGEDGVRKELEEYNISNDSLDKLFDFFKIDINDISTLFKDSDNTILNEGISEVLELNGYINKLGLNECIFTPYLARGLEIYTGTVWEVFDKDNRISSAIGGGGRYDKIITNFINDGNTYPAVGMTFGLVPIYEILSMENVNTNNSLYDLYIIPMDSEIYCLDLASKFRNKGIKVIVEFNNRKLKKSFNWASKNNIPYVMVIGDYEINTGNIKLRDMNNSKDIDVNVDDIDKIIDIINS
ncbi:MAG: histidine--tRNA ligase [Bacilli bacterium]|nr:histidine--tRNA ligase [Bacilli bacterium]